MTPKHYYLLLFLVFVSFVVFWVMHGNDFLLFSTTNGPTVCIENNCYEVEIADTPYLHQRGLMFRESLDENAGMLFVFDESQKYSFWMKNTLVPLDIIWINENKVIVNIKKDAQPCKEIQCPSYKSGQDALYILELNGGVSDIHGLKVGDKVVFKKIN